MGVESSVQKGILPLLTFLVIKHKRAIHEQ